MTETVTTYQVDSLPVNQLPDRYNIGRTAFYERVNALNLQFEKRGNKAIASAEQIDQLDALHDHIKAGNTIESFVASLGEQFTEQSGQLDIASNPTVAMLTLAEMIVSRIPQSQSNPLAHIQMLDEACEKGWKLSTSELCLLLKRSRIAGQEIRRYGFVCTRVGKNGAESAWLIERE